MTYNRTITHWHTLAVTSYEPKKHIKSYIQNTPAKRTDNTNTLTGCISTEPRQMDITENRTNSKSNINNRIKKNERTI